MKPPAQQQSDVRREVRDLLRNWPWVMLLITAIISTTFIALRSGSTLFYFKYVVGDDGTPLFFGLDRSTIFLTSSALGMVLGTAALAPIARRIDKKYYAAGLCFVTGLCFLAFYIIPTDAYATMLALNLVAWFCAGPTTALTWALYADTADYGEWKFGRRTTGLVYSASLFAIKTGVVVGGFLLPFVLDRFGFVRDAEQTALALLGITLTFTVMPGVLGLLKGVALLIYPLDQRKVDEIERALAERRAQSGLEGQPA